MTVLLSVHFKIKNLEPNIHEACRTLFDSGPGTTNKSVRAQALADFFLAPLKSAP